MYKLMQPESNVDYCSCCRRLLSANQICESEGSSGECPAVFITLPIGLQLKRMMEGIHSSVLLVL